MFSINLQYFTNTKGETLGLAAPTQLFALMNKCCKQEVDDKLGVNYEALPSPLDIVSQDRGELTTNVGDDDYITVIIHHITSVTRISNPLPNTNMNIFVYKIFT